MAAAVAVRCRLGHDGGDDDDDDDDDPSTEWHQWYKSGKADFEKLPKQRRRV